MESRQLQICQYVWQHLDLTLKLLHSLPWNTFSQKSRSNFVSFISARPSGGWCRSMDRIHFISVKSSSPSTSENCLCRLSQKRATSDRSSQNSRTHFQRRLRDSSGTSGNIHWWLQKCSLRPWPAVCCMSWVEAIPVPCSHVVHLWKDLQDGLCTTDYWEGWLYFSTL